MMVPTPGSARALDALLSSLLPKAANCSAVVGSMGVPLAVEPARHDLRQRRQRDADGQAMMVIQPMSPLTMAAPPTMPGCGGTTTCAASMMPATGRPNLMGLTPPPCKSRRRWAPG